MTHNTCVYKMKLDLIKAFFHYINTLIRIARSQLQAINFLQELSYER